MRCTDSPSRRAGCDRSHSWRRNACTSPRCLEKHRTGSRAVDARGRCSPDRSRDWRASNEATPSRRCPHPRPLYPNANCESSESRYYTAAAVLSLKCRYERLGVRVSAVVADVRRAARLQFRAIGQKDVEFDSRGLRASAD